MKRYLGTSSGKDKHLVIAEKAFGKRLPKGTVVHHLDYNGRNNANDNLVICPDRLYHRLLHSRTDALMACGNPNWRKCNCCHQWDDPKNLFIKRYEHCTVTHHRSCINEKKRKYIQRKKLP